MGPVPWHPARSSADASAINTWRPVAVGREGAEGKWYVVIDSSLQKRCSSSPSGLPSWNVSSSVPHRTGRRITADRRTHRPLQCRPDVACVPLLLSFRTSGPASLLARPCTSPALLSTRVDAAFGESPGLSAVFTAAGSVAGIATGGAVSLLAFSGFASGRTSLLGGATGIDGFVPGDTSSVGVATVTPGASSSMQRPRSTDRQCGDDKPEASFAAGRRRVGRCRRGVRTRGGCRAPWQHYRAVVSDGVCGSHFALKLHLCDRFRGGLGIGEGG